MKTKNFTHFFLKCQIKKLTGTPNELKQDGEMKKSYYLLTDGHINIVGIIRSRPYLTS